MNRWIAIGAAVGMTAVLAGCSGTSKKKDDAGKPFDGQTVKVTVQHTDYNVKEITVQKGVPVKVVLTNKDFMKHDFTIDTIPVSAVSGGSNDRTETGGKTPDIHLTAGPRKVATLTFTPDRAGAYTFYCSVFGHREAGMEGTFTVQ